MSIEERQKTIKKHPKNNQKMPKNYPDLDFHHLKTFYKMLRLGIFPVFDNIFTAYILGMWEWVLLHNELVSQYSCKNLPKTDDNDGTYKNDVNKLS